MHQKQQIRNILEPMFAKEMPDEAAQWERIERAVPAASAPPVSRQLGRRKPLVVMICLVTVLAIACGAFWVGGANPPAYGSYRELVKQRNWDAKLEEALEVARNTNPHLSTMHIKDHSEAFRMVYELGPEVVPYILDKIEASGKNRFDEMFLIAAATCNLQLPDLYLPEDTSIYASALKAEHYSTCPQNYTFFLRVFLDEVPDKVNEICRSKQSQEQKLQALDRLGVAALPYLAQRIEKGETQWKVCFENQLLGLSADERFEYLKEQETSLYTESPKTVDDFYTMKQSHVKPVDVDKWMADNAVTLDALRYACER
jgi:hypothetical protein